MMDTDSAFLGGCFVGIIGILIIIFVAIPAVGIAVDEMNKYRASDDYLQGYNIGLNSCHDYLKFDAYDMSIYGWGNLVGSMPDNHDLAIIPASQKTGYDAGITQCDKVKTLERDLFMACRLRQPQAADLVTTGGIYLNGTRIERAYDWEYTCRGTVYHGDDKVVSIDELPKDAIITGACKENCTFLQLRSEAL